MNSSDSFPLKWPINRPRTGQYQRRHAAFKTSMSRARDNMLAELKRLGASQVVISTNIETYVRGGQTIPYSNQNKVSEDPGVAVYYSWKGEQYCLCCDKYKSVMDNMQAINKTVEAIRGIERWGTGEMMRAAFQGFKELPEPPKESWNAWEVLGIRVGAPPVEIKTAYKNKVKIYHPDIAGGNGTMFLKIQRAYEELMND